MKKLSLILLTLLSAVLLPLAMPNDIFKYGSALIGLFCLVPYFYAICQSPSYQFALLMGAIFGAVSNALMYYWLMFFGEYSVWTLGGVVGGYIVYNSILVLVLRGFVTGFPRLRIFILAAAWVAYEYLKSIGFLGFPWALMAHPFHDILPIIQIADVTGVWGISLLAILVNSFICEVILCWPAKPLPFTRLFGNRRLVTSGIIIVSLIVVTFVYGLIRLNTPIPVQNTISALLIQQNIDPWTDGNYEESVLNAIELTESGLQAVTAKPDIVIWNETSVQDFLMDNPHRFESFPKNKPLLPFIRAQNSYFLIGAPKIFNRETQEVMNAAILVTPQGEPVQFYGKQHPVPFAEKVPFWDWPPARKFYNDVLGFQRSGWTMGKEYTLFNMQLANGNVIRFGTPICFEDAFADINRKFILAGADLWINLTNVSWSKRESAEIQMFVAAKFRTVENKRVLIRSTNSGVTSVIDPYGRTLKQLPLFKSSYLSIDVPVYKEKALTFYTKAGDYLPIIFLYVLLAALVLKKTGLLDKLLRLFKIR